MSTIKIAMADDHTLFRKGLLSMIQSQVAIDIVAEGDNGKDLLDAIEKSKQIPDITIVDLSMPVMNGYDLIPHLQKLYPTTKILVISFVIEPNAIQHLFNVGVHGFIDKSDAKIHFASVLTEVLEIGYYKNEHYLPKQKEPLNWKKNKFHGSIPFTHEEMTFMKYKVKGLLLKEIADIMCLSPKTVENYRNSIYRKLGINSREEVIEYAKSIGLEKWDA
jgi:DNA-binding NarL/FixJ family response regulator